MFGIGDRELVKYERALSDLKRSALPFATQKTINDMAFHGRKRSIAQIKRTMTIRNKFTERSIQVTPTRERQISWQQSILGSTRDYMEDQEFGAVERGGGSIGKPIYTPYASGEGLSARPRHKLPRKPNKLQNIMLARKSKKGKTRAQQNLIAVREAAASGHKYVYMDTGRRKGLFKVLGGKRRPYVRMVYNLSEKTVTVKPNPWLAPSVERVMVRDRAPLYRRALEYQLRRHGIFQD